MGSISNCIKRLGKALSPEEATALKQSAEANMRDGMPREEAERAAVQAAIERTLARLDRLIETANKRAGTNVRVKRGNPEAARSAAPNREAALATVKFMRALKNAGGFFKNPIVDSADLQEILDRLIPNKVENFQDLGKLFGDLGNGLSGFAFAVRGRDLEAIARGEDGDVRAEVVVTRQGDTIHADLAALKRGMGGSAIYDALSQYAYANGLKFVEDPHGVTDDALVRRTENMLNSVIKMGTTRHLAPGTKQLAGDPKIGMDPLEWRDGDDNFNTLSLLKTLNRFYNRTAPQINGYRYDFESGDFRDADGNTVSDEQWVALGAATATGDSRAGVSTLKRMVLARSVAREAGTDRGRQLLSQTAQQYAAGVVPPAARGIGYSRGNLSGAKARAAVSAAVKAAVAAIKAGRTPRAARGLGNAVGQAGVAAGQQAQSNTRVNRVTNQVAAARKRAANRIAQLGQLGYPTQGIPGWMTNASSWSADNTTVAGVIRDGGWNRKTLVESLRLLRRRFQDRMIAVRDVQQDIESWLGGTIDDMLNVYQAENLMHGAVGDQIRSFDRDYLEPLAKIMGESGITQEQLDQYLYAKHAPDRNARIRKINPSNNAGSGMTDAEAAQIMAGFTADERAALQRAEKVVRDIIDNTRTTLYEAGLIPDDTYRALQADSTYVPLRTKKKNEAGEMRVDSVGQGLDTRGQDVQRALGRATKAENILGEIIGDAHRAFVRSGKNDVGQTLLRLALQYPNKDVWEVERVDTKKAINEATGLVYDRVVDDKWSENTFYVRVDGKPYKVTLHHEGMARAMKNLGVEQNVPRWYQRAMRLYSSMLTSLNPDFALVNPLRDLMQSAMITQSQKMDSKQIVKLWAKARTAMRADIRNGSTRLTSKAYKDSAEQKKWMDYAREFSEIGGRTGWTTTRPINEIIDDVNAKIDDEIRKNKPHAAAQRAITGLFQWVEDVNEANENATRLAAYAMLRESGKSAEQAATFAKNLTVNFNRRGEYAASANAWFIFFNAAMQGAHTIGAALKSPAFQKMMGALFMTQFTLALAQAWDVDDDGEYQLDKINIYDKERKLILWVGSDGSKVTLPLPYGISYASFLGTQMAEIIRDVVDDRPNRIPAGKRAADTVAALVNSFSPVRIENPLMMAIPDLFDPIAQAQVNRDNFGRVISPEQTFGKFKESDADQYWPGTNWIWTTAAQATKALEPFMGPEASISPNSIQHVFQQWGGGPMRFISDMAEMAANLKNDRWDLAGKSIPVARQVYGGGNPNRSTNTLFLEKRERVYRLLDQAERRFRAGQGWDDLVAKHPNILAGVQFMATPSGEVRKFYVPGTASHSLRLHEKMLDDNQKYIRIVQDSSMEPSEKRRVLDQLFAYREQVQRNYNLQFNSIADNMGGRQ